MDEKYSGFYNPSPAEKQAVVEWLFRTAREKIERVGVGSVDMWARWFTKELEFLDADEESKEIHKLYERTW